MSIEELMQLRVSPEAPFDHQAYTVWLHNKILENIQNEIHIKKNHSNKLDEISALNDILCLQSLQKIN